MKLPGHAWRVIYRAKNTWWDMRAHLAGYCNHCPNDGIPGQGGGYTFWRCGLRRRHEGLHRSNNYVWTDDGTTDYLPLPYGHSQGATQPRAWRRSAGTMTRRQRRNRDAWHREQGARRKARLG
jgi:hypothetical protein